MFDFDKPIVFEVEVANLDSAVKWQNLIQTLMSETDMFTIGSMRDGNSETDFNDYKAVTLLLIAKQESMSQPVGIGSVSRGEVGLAILKQFQRAGLGQLLLTELITWAEENDIFELWLDVQTNNQVAIHIYHKFNFVNQGYETSFTLPNGKVAKLQRMTKYLKEKE